MSSYLATEVPTYRNTPSYLPSLRYFLNLIPFFFISICLGSSYHFRISMTNIHSPIKGFSFLKIMKIYEFQFTILTLSSLSHQVLVSRTRYFQSGTRGCYPFWFLFHIPTPINLPLFFFFSYFYQAFTVSHTIFSFLYMSLLEWRNWEKGFLPSVNNFMVSCDPSLLRVELRYRLSTFTEFI